MDVASFKINNMVVGIIFDKYSKSQNLMFSESAPATHDELNCEWNGMSGRTHVGVQRIIKVNNYRLGFNHFQQKSHYFKFMGLVR